MRHPGDYLARRMGRGRQCWSYCDRTPCRCDERTKRTVRRIERRRAVAELRDTAAEIAADGPWFWALHLDVMVCCCIDPAVTVEECCGRDDGRENIAHAPRAAERFPVFRAALAN